MLAAGDLQRFSNGVGRDWRKVGRALGKNCRALKGPAIDNLAYEYEREGLYEQAYQLLSRFIQAEGSAARLGRLVRALEDSKLTSLAENILDIQPREWRCLSHCLGLCVGLYVCVCVFVKEW